MVTRKGYFQGGGEGGFGEDFVEVGWSAGVGSSAGGRFVETLDDRV